MIRIKITTNDKPTPRGKIHDIIEHAINEAAVSKVKEMLGDLRDPETGKEATVSFEMSDTGLVIGIKGSDFVLQEGLRRLNLPAGN